MKRIYIDTEFDDLLNYIVTYRKLRASTSKKMVVEQLIHAYAKQLAVGMPEEAWRQTMLDMINKCEK